MQEFASLSTPHTEAVGPFGASTATFTGKLTPLNVKEGSEYFFYYNLGEEGFCTNERETTPKAPAPKPYPPLSPACSRTIPTRSVSSPRTRSAPSRTWFLRRRRSKRSPPPPRSKARPHRIAPKPRPWKRRSTPTTRPPPASSNTVRTRRCRRARKRRPWRATPNSSVMVAAVSLRRSCSPVCSITPRLLPCQRKQRDR